MRHHLVIFTSARLNTRASPSFPAATIKPGSDRNRRFKIAPEEPRNAATSFLLSKLQSRIIWSSPVAANIVPCALKSTDHTSWVGVVSVAMGDPDASSHRRTVLSQLPET